MLIALPKMAGMTDAAAFECRAGWRGLIVQAAAEVAAMPDLWRVRIVGGKEKMGSLILFIYCDGQRPIDLVDCLCEAYRKKSITVCEECGAPGRLRMGVVAATRCEQHADFVAPFRDDDGEIIDLPPTGGPIWRDGHKGRYSPSVE